MSEIPYAEIETVFLDVGNTLMSIDFELVARELADLGHKVEPAALRRAEAAARPAISRTIKSEGTEGPSAFGILLRTVLAKLPAAPAAAALEELAQNLEPRIRFPGASDKLWNSVMPGVPAALRQMRDQGLRLVAVSNADGTVERGLTAQGLRPMLDLVIDSHVVGFQKPHPRIFEIALEQSGADPARTLHIGDLYAADIVGARAAGCHAGLIDPHDDWGALDCAKFRDVSEVARALAEAGA